MSSRISILIFTMICFFPIMRAQNQYPIAISDASSLVRVGMDPHPTDSVDTEYATMLLCAIEDDDLTKIAEVRDVWQRKAENNLAKDKAYSSLCFLLSHYIGAKTNKDDSSTLDPLSLDLYNFFMADSAAHLKDYLVLKYQLNNYRPRSVKQFIEQRTFYEDMLMFNDPNREQWDCTSDIMAQIPLEEGKRVVDVGCGFGFNTMRLHAIVGEKGVVYATDTEASYIDYIQGFCERYGIVGVAPIVSSSNSLSVDDKVDLIFMSSFYHILYTWSREDERRSFFQSVVESLNEDGYIVVIDNVNLHGGELNNCHVHPRLIEAQLGFWGFGLTKESMLSDQRYMLIFQKGVEDNKIVKAQSQEDNSVLMVSDSKSVVHIGSLDSYDITDRGIDAAQYVYDFVGGGGPELANIAIEKYNELIPSENFGGEYTALQWLCEVMIAEDEAKEQMLKDRLARSFYHKLTSNDCAALRYYLLHKYKLGNEEQRMQSDSLLEMSGEVGRTHRSYLEDYILALNPRRPQWEMTDSLLRHIGLKSDETIADIGSGSGFFTDKFATMARVVYAVEIKDEHIQTLQDFLDEEDIQNVRIIKGEETALELPEQVDKLFMCSLYHILYGVTSDADRDAYLRSLVKTLKPDGELIIVDNGPVDDDTLPYHGPYIRPDLIEMQLSFYGLYLTDKYQIIPQRYMLKFKLMPQK